VSNTCACTLAEFGREGRLDKGQPLLCLDPWGRLINQAQCRVRTARFDQRSTQYVVGAVHHSDYRRLLVGWFESGRVRPVPHKGRQEVVSALRCRFQFAPQNKKKTQREHDNIFAEAIGGCTADGIWGVLLRQWMEFSAVFAFGPGRQYSQKHPMASLWATKRSQPAAQSEEIQTKYAQW